MDKYLVISVAKILMVPSIINQCGQYDSLIEAIANVSSTNPNAQYLIVRKIDVDPKTGVHKEEKIVKLI